MKKTSIIFLCCIILLLIIVVYKIGIRMQPRNSEPFSNVWEKRNAQGILYKDILSTIVEKTQSVLDTRGERMVAMYGTLLGIVRHGDIIPWDDDADFFASDTVLKDMYAHRDELEVYGMGMVKKYIVNMKYFYKVYMLNEPRIPGKSWSWPFIDLFPCTLQSKPLKQYSGGTLQHTTLHVMDTSYPFIIKIDRKDWYPLKKVPFLKTYTWIPQHSNRILNNMHGKGWNTECISTGYNHRKENIYSNSYKVSCEQALQSIDMDSMLANVYIVQLNQEYSKRLYKQFEYCGIHAKHWFGTHNKLWEYLYKHGVQCAVVVDSDCILSDEFTVNLLRKLVHQSQGMDILYLGYANNGKNKVAIGSSKKQHGYIITYNGLKKVNKVTGNSHQNIYKVCTSPQTLCFLAPDKNSKNIEDMKGSGIIFKRTM